MFSTFAPIHNISFNIYCLSCMQDYGNKDVIIYSKVRSKERTRSKKNNIKG